MADIFELSYRTNINVYDFNGKRVVLYDDHRTILNVTYFSLANKLLENTPNVISFDYHDDAIGYKVEDNEFGKRARARELSLNEFWSFVEFQLGTNDDNWVRAGMETGVINHYLNIGGAELYNLDNIENNRITDHFGQSHELYSLGHLDSALSARGCLGDFCICNPYYERVREIIGYNLNNDHEFVDEECQHPFVLDFDLDCFSGQIAGGMFAWPKKLFFDRYVNDKLVFDFIKDLIEQAKVITICREPNFCGGIGESNKILGYLDKYFFKGALGN